MYMVKIQKFCNNNNDNNLNKKRQYCIMYTTFDERRVWDIKLKKKTLDILWNYYYSTGLQKKKTSEFNM